MQIAIVVLPAFCCSAAMGQRGFSGAHGGAHFAGFAAHHGGRYWGGYPYGALYGDSLLSDDSAQYPFSMPSVVVIQQPAAAQASEPQVSPPAQPLLIELRGGRYVPVSEEADSGDSIDVAEKSGSRPAGIEMSRTSIALTSIAPPSTILVFRDGTRQEISGYTIADGMLYAQANYYADGSWNKRIELSWLNVPETVSANRARGVLFKLPGSPNEVIVGP